MINIWNWLFGIEPILDIKPKKQKKLSNNAKKRNRRKRNRQKTQLSQPIINKDTKKDKLIHNYPKKEYNNIIKTIASHIIINIDNIESKYKKQKYINELSILNNTQRNIITYFNNKFINKSDDKIQEIINYYNDKDITREDILNLFSNNKVNINFNDWRDLYNISQDTHYRNQFEVHASNGTYDLSSRMVWENNIFKNYYNSEKPFNRVKYGNLNVSLYKRNPMCNGYGKCSFVLKDSIKQRCTFTMGDTSRLTDTSIRTFDYPYFIYDDIYKDTFLSLIKNGHASLLSYIEVQIHGPIQINRDVEYVMAPLSFKNNKTLLDLSIKNNIPIDYY